jgi:ribosome-binding protein aMBF1 (putative translation factor)
MMIKHNEVSYEDFKRKIIGSDKKRELAIQFETAKLVLIENLVSYREKKGLTQKQLADKLGVKQQVVARVENGSNITLETLIKFLDVLGIVLKVEAVQRKRHEQILQFV